MDIVVTTSMFCSLRCPMVIFPSFPSFMVYAFALSSQCWARSEKGKCDFVKLHYLPLWLNCEEKKNIWYILKNSSIILVKIKMWVRLFLNKKLMLYWRRDVSVPWIIHKDKRKARIAMLFLTSIWYFLSQETISTTVW